MKPEFSSPTIIRSLLKVSKNSWSMTSSYAAGLRTAGPSCEPSRKRSRTLRW